MAYQQRCWKCKLDKWNTQFPLESGGKCFRCLGMKEDPNIIAGQRNNHQVRATQEPGRKRTLVTARDRNRLWIEEYFKKNPCMDCGETDVRVLSFDHVRGVKLGNVSNFVYRGALLKTVETEVDKCEVVCLNCHKRRTDERRLMKKSLQMYDS